MPTPAPTPPPSAQRFTPLPAANRPRIRIQIPPPSAQGHYLDARSPFIQSARSNPSQSGNGAPQWPSSPYVNPFSPSDKDSMNAGEYIFKQFAGIKDFTMDWTKSGLNHGEKTVFTLYESIRRWSRKWFTHVFLMFIVFLYSTLGAYIFIVVEGKSGKKLHSNSFFFNIQFVTNNYTHLYFIGLILNCLNKWKDLIQCANTSTVNKQKPFCTFNTLIPLKPDGNRVACH